MDDVSVTWKDKNKWVPFDLSDINHMSRDHAVNLFSFSIPVIARQGQVYIVNNETLYEGYDKKQKPVKMFSELMPSDKPLGQVGFI